MHVNHPLDHPLDHTLENCAQAHLAECLHQLVKAQAARSPDAVAIEGPTGSLTYAELARKAGLLALHLRALGVGPEQVVGVCLERTPDLVVGLLGVLKAGGAYLPLDPRYPKDRLRFMLQDSGAHVVVTQPSLYDRLQCATVLPVSINDLGPRPAPMRVPADPRPENLAYVIYTSGSTGRPKGVQIEHRNAVAFVKWALATFSPTELARVLASTSVCFDLSVFELFVPLAVGGTVVLVHNALELANGSARDITLLNTVPSALREVLNLGSLPATVSTINVAGEPLSNALAQAAYGSESVQRVLNLYGPTEDTTYSTYAHVVRGSLDSPSIGRPIDNAQVHVLGQHLEPLPMGFDGELFIGGAGLARGYLGRPDLTADRFVPNPFATRPGQRLYRTGDRVCWRSDGQLEFLGRLDRQVKLRGFRIELGEIEAAVSALPGVREAVVLMREDLPGQQQLVAYVVPEPSTSMSSADPAHLRAALAVTLPEYMLPSAVVVLDVLPLTPNGKVDRHALPAPDRAPVVTSAAAQPPVTDTERVVASIWAEVLGIAHFDRNANFFDLGGHSLLAARVV